MFRSHKFWVWIAVGWALLAGICLVETWPKWPETKGQWAILVVVGPPLYILFEWLGEKILMPTNRPVQNSSAVSFRRILVLLFRLAVLFAVFWGVIEGGSLLLGR